MGEEDRKRSRTLETDLLSLPALNGLVGMLTAQATLALPFTYIDRSGHVGFSVKQRRIRASLKFHRISIESTKI